MVKKRLVAVLIVRDGLVVQSVQFKHTNAIHYNPVTAIEFFDKWAVDEVVILDVSRTPEDRPTFYQNIEDISKVCFVPLTVGGWVDSLDEMKRMLRLGADKVIVNSAAVENPKLITEAAQVLGSQCVVVSIDVDGSPETGYQVVVDRGRKPTGRCPVEWAREAEERGAGEVFLNHIKRDGFRQGYDLGLVKSLSSVLRIPLVAMGGVLEWRHLVDGVIQGGAEAVAAANIFHYTEHSACKAKEAMRMAGIDVR